MRMSQYYNYIYNILEMDLIMGVVSMVKDLNSIDKEYRNLNLQLKYTLEKANRMIKKINNYQRQSIGFVVLTTRMAEGQKLTKKLDDLLNAQAIAIKDKIRLSLPLDKTKTEIISVIQTIEKTINDLKEELEQDKLQTKVENKCELKEGGMKRKITQSAAILNQQSNLHVLKNQLTIQQIDKHLDQVYQMGPTIRDDQYQLSQNKTKQGFIQFKILIHGSDQILKILQAQQLVQTKSKITEKNIPSQQVLYTVARINFQKCYAKIKALTQDIDRISTKGHFHLIFRKMGQASNELVPCRITSSTKKGQKNRVSSSQKHQEEVFFSFPTEQKSNNNFEFKLIAKKQDQSKTLYRVCGQQWVKVEQPQIQITNGEKLAAFINPKTKQPSIYFQLCYEICQN